MKSFTGFCFLLFIVSCSETTETPAEPTPKRDTNKIRTTSINPLGAPDISAMDISYFPVDYPLTKMSATALSTPAMRVIYSRPHKQGRKIFGNLLKYGEAWRLGANEATEIEFFRDVKIQQKTVSKGRYVMYCIPEEKQWTIVLNGNIFSWGLKPDTSKGLHRFPIAAEKTQAIIEHFTMVFQKTATGADLVIAWDDTMARFPITF